MNPVNLHEAPTLQLSNTRGELFIAQVESARVDHRFQVMEPRLVGAGSLPPEDVGGLDSGVVLPRCGQGVTERGPTNFE